MGASQDKAPEPASPAAGHSVQSSHIRPGEQVRIPGPDPRRGYYYYAVAGTRDPVQSPATSVRHRPAGTAPPEITAFTRSATMSSPQNIVHVADRSSAFAALMANWDDFRLFQLTTSYRDRLQPAVEGVVHNVSLALKTEDQFSTLEQQTVNNLSEQGYRAESSELLLNLVMEKGSRAQRVMWECFSKLRNRDPKLVKILEEIWELGPTPYANWDLTKGALDFPTELTGAQQRHKETLRTVNAKVNATIILRNGGVKVFQLADRFAEFTVISTPRPRRLAEHELLARGQELEQLTDRQIPGELLKIRVDQLFTSGDPLGNSQSGKSAALAGASGIGKTTVVQKFVLDWASGRMCQHFQFIFSFKFRDLNSINCAICLRELLLDHYPYLRNVLVELWRNAARLLFIFDGFDEFKDRIDFADRQGDAEPQHVCTDPKFRCNVSDIVYSLIQHKLLPGCSVLVTSRPTELHLLEKAGISVRAEILGFVGEERKEYFSRHFEDQAVAAAVFKHVQENEILYTMSYNPSYCKFLALALGPFFAQPDRDPQQAPKTITQLYSHYISNILKKHGREIESPRDVLLRVGQMAFRGLAEREFAFTDGDLFRHSLQFSQFLSGFLRELLEREGTRNVMYMFPHLTIQEFVAALAHFLTSDPVVLLEHLAEARRTADGRYEVFLRFVAGLASAESAGPLQELLGAFPNQTTSQVTDWVKEEVARRISSTASEDGKRGLLKALHYLFESQDGQLAQCTLGSAEALSLRRLRLTRSDCAVLSHAIGHCDAVKHLDLRSCSIQRETLKLLAPGLHRCQELGLGNNQLGDSGMKLVAAALSNVDCKIEKLRLYNNGLQPFCASDFAGALSTNRSLTELDLAYNNLGDSGVKQVSVVLRNPNCKIQRLRLDGVNLTDSCTEYLTSALSANYTLRELKLNSNCLTDRSVPALHRLILNHQNLKSLGLQWNLFSKDGENQLISLRELVPKFIITI
ncbi:NACHT, LRR and PYD domains-containing protein 3-like [Mobula hypostoma]|uniref:NACHT, LRR and PYD domains-containing protein 3-like n=1 Tax=Mobula hypostoma TaxID=723540 RepID=UPI002FC3C35D